MSIKNSQRRSGLTLLEIIISVAIFLGSLAAIWQLLLIGNENALNVKLQAHQHCLPERDGPGHDHDADHVAKRLRKLRPLGFGGR